ncbi:hexosaminidase D [Platysternon megacephalum]|uniref:Hexosaminidase D n=1 Tax=Platysternon megacephalum TaxID=55544 RepID=A0A4D9DX86_9SAUR|nr:hexosaminidase D [Platysternon megacephalum]
MIDMGFPPFEQFLWEHWDYPKTQVSNQNTYCDIMMWKQELYGKLKHTFIHEPIKKIINVCRGEGKHLWDGWYQSKHFFNITKCKFNCMFGHYTGLGMSTKIVIRCKYGFPVAIQE